jgi:C-terminal processing protease CtpA/Prc
MIYISSVMSGSPANLYGIEPNMFIKSVAGKNVATLEEFQSAIQATDETYFTMSTLLPNCTKIISLKKMEDRFPSVLYTTDVLKGIKRTALSSVGAADDGNYEE